MIKHLKEEKLFLNWLSINLILLLSIIIVGGLTRLTNSGLSITEWELFKGIFPPMSEQSWLNYFELYKQIPQFTLLYPNMNLDEFKVIFYWEYFHRVLGRLIGLFFIVPLIYFYFQKKIQKKYLKLCIITFLLIVAQGAVGWYMVQSGLVNDVTVSHYRLSLHLILALLIASMIFWILVNFKNSTNKIFFNFNRINFPYLILIFLIFTQIILGAFVSGLDAGRIYQTWPLMGLSYIPNDFLLNNLMSFFDFNNQSMVQFYHRNLAYVLTIYILIFSFFILKDRKNFFYMPVIIVNFFLFLQVALGIFTLVSGLNILLASAHQITSVLLIFSVINLYYLQIK